MDGPRLFTVLKVLLDLSVLGIGLELICLELDSPLNELLIVSPTQSFFAGNLCS